MKLSHWIGAIGVGALLAPMFAFAEDPPVPLPRRPDRMPTGISVSASPPPAASSSTAPLALAAAPAPAPRTAVEAVTKVVANPQPVTLVAKIADGGVSIPDGLVWRVFETKTDAAGELALAAKSNDATAHLSLQPGSYVVHVAYGRAQTTDTITVQQGKNERAVVLDAGAIRLNAAIAGDVSIPINMLKFDIFTSRGGNDRTMVAQNIAPNDIVTLNAGTYHVVSHFGDVNAVVRADLRVEPGQITEATVYHKAGQVSFKLVSEAGGEAIADIDWTVKTQDGQTIFSAIGAFPSTVLAEGDYLVLAKRGETVYNREFQVQPGAPREVEVLTSVY